jgi:tetratricopeptide (TPR) repeat protein
MSSPDLQDRPTALAAEGYVALGAGDTARASKLFKQAAEVLEAEIPKLRKQSEKVHHYYLVATQYYNGGMYAKAEVVNRRVQVKLLSGGVRPGFEHFRNEVKDRASPEYRKRIKALIRRAWDGKQFANVLEFFKEHPYVLTAGVMAFLRACCCEYLKHYRAAALFFNDTLKFNPDKPGMIFRAAAHPLSLMSDDNLDEAWVYVEHQLAVIHHAIPSVCASLLCLHRASRAKTMEEERHWSDEQIRYCSMAWRLFGEMATQHQQNLDMRELMTHCLEAAVFGWLRLHNHEEAVLAANRAVEFNSSSSGAWIARGIVTYPSGKAVRDFLQAVKLEEKEYTPYYFLAHWSIHNNDFAETAGWCEQALNHNPSPRIRAQLLEMLAIARFNLDVDPKEVEALFEQAQELDPESRRIKYNRTVFQEAVDAATAPEPSKWDRSGIENGNEINNAFLERERVFLEKRQPGMFATDALIHVAS